MKLTELRKQFTGTLYFDGFRLFYKPTKEEYAKRDYFSFSEEDADLYEMHDYSWIVSDLNTKDMVANDCALIQELIGEIAEYAELDETYVEECIEFLLVDENIYIIKLKDNFVSYNLDYQSWELTDSIINVISVYGENIKDVF